MINIVQSQESIYNLALSQDGASFIIGQQEFIKAVSKDTLFVNVLYDIDVNKNNFRLKEISSELPNLIILEVCQNTLGMAQQIVAEKEKNTKIILVFCEISRELLIPFSKIMSDCYLTINMNDDYIQNNIQNKEFGKEFFSQEIINFLSYMEV